MWIDNGGGDLRKPVIETWLFLFQSCFDDDDDDDDDNNNNNNSNNNNNNNNKAMLHVTNRKMF